MEDMVLMVVMIALLDFSSYGSSVSYGGQQCYGCYSSCGIYESYDI